MTDIDNFTPTEIQAINEYEISNNSQETDLDYTNEMNTFLSLIKLTNLKKLIFKIT